MRRPPGSKPGDRVPSDWWEERGLQSLACPDKWYLERGADGVATLLAEPPTRPHSTALRVWGPTRLGTLLGIYILPTIPPSLRRRLSPSQDASTRRPAPSVQSHDGAAPARLSPTRAVGPETGPFPSGSGWRLVSDPTSSRATRCSDVPRDSRLRAQSGLEALSCGPMASGTVRSR
jgi:hypothetical protein